MIREWQWSDEGVGACSGVMREWWWSDEGVGACSGVMREWVHAVEW